MSDRYPDLASSTTRCRTPSCLGGALQLEVLFNFFFVSCGRRLFMRGHVESLIRHAGRRMTDRSWGTETPEDARAHEERAALVGDVEEVVRRLTERLRGRVSEGGDLPADALFFHVLHQPPQTPTPPPQSPWRSPLENSITSLMRSSMPAACNASRNAFSSPVFDRAT